jgi:hypothetical protein
VKTSERDTARKLRSEGYSVREIERLFGVARSTASLWVRDIELTPEQREALRIRPRAVRTDFRRKREHYQADGRATARRGEALHASGCMRFWAEGSKNVNTAQIANSHAALLRLAATFLRPYFGVPDEKFRVMCNLFADHVERQHAVEQYWFDALELPRSCLTKTMVNHYSRSSQRKRRGTLPYGTRRISVYDVRIAQHLYGAIQEYGGFDRPEWLG